MLNTFKYISYYNSRCGLFNKTYHPRNALTNHATIDFNKSCFTTLFHYLQLRIKSFFLCSFFTSLTTSILQKHLPRKSLSCMWNKVNEVGCNPDDLLVAVCLAVTACLMVHRICEIIPDVQ